MMELPATLTGLQRALAGGEFSQQEALKAQRERLLHLDSEIHCVVQSFEDAEGDKRTGALAGVGLAHKDIFDTVGRRPGLGHDKGTLVEGLNAASVITQLQAAGASQLAALSMAQYACGATGDNSQFTRCLNPINQQAALGGSSSGSAAAVASEIAYGSLGTDTAGSVRIPAATCALVGLKTTHGLISSNGVFPLASSLDSVGILARSAADAEQLLLAIVGNKKLRSANHTPRLKAWLPETGLHASVAAALERFALEQVAIGNTGQLNIKRVESHRVLTDLSEIVLHHEAAVTHRTELLEGTLSPLVEAVAMMGLVLPEPWYHAALRDRSKRAIAFVNDYLFDADILMLPALPQPVPDWTRVCVGHPDFDVREFLALHSFMGFVNYLGFPSLVMPIARDERGMPISAQFIARPFQERILLSLANRFELEHFGNNGLTRHFSPTLKKVD
jgi:aspartyl-tRNA(Asn)/glutamyl-tRNA(Gln) amidotransferase subunit A